MITFKPYVDGWVGTSGHELTVVPRPRIPFENNPTPDVFSRVWERDFEFYPTLFQPRIATRTSWTNLVTYSEDPTNAAWTKTNLTAAAAVTTAPDGNSTLGRLLETVTNGEHSISQAATVAASATEVSVFVKPGLTRTRIKLAFTDFAATAFSAFFNIESGVADSAAAGTTAFVTPMIGGFFRCGIRFTPAAGAGSLKINVATTGSTISYAGNTANGIYFWGAQVSTGTSAPYVSTTSATRTILAPDVDSADPLAFLVREDEPQPYSSETQIVRKGFARVPLTQVVPSFIRINKPSVPGSLPATVGNYVLTQPDAAFRAFDAYARQFVATDSGPDFGVGGIISGGTYTIEFDGDTTAPILWNAAASVVQSALNALSSVADRGGVTVTGDYLTGFVVTFAFFDGVGGDATGLTFSGGTGVGLTAGILDGGYRKYVNFQGVGGATITGGTIKVTSGTDQTAPVAFNASATTLQAAINLLSSSIARGGATVFATPSPIFSGGLVQCNWVFQNPAFTVDGTNLLPLGGTGTVARLDPFSLPGISGFYGRQQSIGLSGATIGPRFVTTTAPHGITNADYIYAKAGDTYYTLAPGQFDVSAPDEITLDADSGAIASTSDAITEIGLRVRTGYSPGTVTVRCVRTTTFYLPGVTPGIATAADIEPPVYQGDSDTMLALILAGGGAFNYDVGELSPWMGPIISLTVVTILASDL